MGNGAYLHYLEESCKNLEVDNMDIPITEPVIQKRVTGLLPYLSLISPIKGEAVN